LGGGAIDSISAALVLDDIAFVTLVDVGANFLFFVDDFGADAETFAAAIATAFSRYGWMSTREPDSSQAWIHAGEMTGFPGGTMGNRCSNSFSDRESTT